MQKCKNHYKVLQITVKKHGSAVSWNSEACLRDIVVSFSFGQMDQPNVYYQPIMGLNERICSVT